MSAWGEYCDIPLSSFPNQVRRLVRSPSDCHPAALSPPLTLAIPSPDTHPPPPVLLRESRDTLSFGFGVWDVCFHLEKNKGKRPVSTAQEARVRRERTPTPGAASAFGGQCFLLGVSPTEKVAGPLLTVKGPPQRRRQPQMEGAGE